MRNKLDRALPPGKITHMASSGSEIYVADYATKTQSGRKVEACTVKPDDMDVFTLKNEVALNITVSIFGEQCLMDGQNKEIKHCECILYPTNSNSNTWILFVEIKDCKPKNISGYFVYAKEQIIRTVELFRDRKLLGTNKKVHAVISFPKNKTDFYHKIISHNEQMLFFRQHKIIIKCANTVAVKSDRSIS